MDFPSSREQPEVAEPSNLGPRPQLIRWWSLIVAQDVDRKIDLDSLP